MSTTMTFPYIMVLCQARASLAPQRRYLQHRCTKCLFLTMPKILSGLLLLPLQHLLLLMMVQFLLQSPLSSLLRGLLNTIVSCLPQHLLLHCELDPAVFLRLQNVIKLEENQKFVSQTVP